MNLTQLKPLIQQPTPFTPGETLFWDDPHISSQMLKAHLDSTKDLASRRPQIIDRSVAWLVESLGLQPGEALLDLGCGPGLYASRFAQHGLQVTGIDYSQRSIQYARNYADQHQLDIEYRYQNYLELADANQYRAALLIFGDFCPLSPAQREKLLQNIHRALLPGGFFVLDVTTPLHHHRYGSRNSWYLTESGFWKPGLHLVLEEGFEYPEQSIHLDQAIVIEDGGQVSVYRMWFQDYQRETITRELESGGFTIQSVWSDLVGTPFVEDTEWIGVVAKRTA